MNSRPPILRLVVALLFTSSTLAKAATVTAASCSTSAVQTAINQAQEGDVVVIPAGSCTWTSQVAIAGKGIHLKGATKGSVTINNNGGALISIDADASHAVELSNLRLIEGTSTADAHLNVGSSAGERPVLVHDSYFETNGKMLRSIRWNGPGGVIWNNEFYSNGNDDQAIVINGPSNSWTTADSMGTRDTGGTTNVYIEDNVFRQLVVQALDPDSNSRVVIRHNSFLFSGMASHGADTSIDGTRHWEVYENTFTFTNYGDCDGSQTPGLNWYFFIRGGTGVIADNVMPDINSCAWGNKPEINMTVMNLRRNSGPYPCWATYPAPRQIGQGHNGTTTITDPVYIWGNTGGGSQTPGLSDYSPNECGAGAPSTSQFLQAGRDFIVGTARPGYTKYAYPHPMRAAATPGTAPAAPRNLRVR